MTRTSSVIDRRIEAAIQRMARRSFARRWARAIADPTHPITTNERAILLAILLVECTARPKVVRAIEWVVAVPLRTGLLGNGARSVGEGITVGPFQQPASPFRREAAVTVAANRLTMRPGTVQSTTEMARYWNGPASETNGPMPYGRAIRLALPYAERLLRSHR